MLTIDRHSLAANNSASVQIKSIAASTMDIPAPVVANRFSLNRFATVLKPAEHYWGWKWRIGIFTLRGREHVNSAKHGSSSGVAFIA